MKTIIRHFLLLAAILTGVSCAREQAAPVTEEKTDMIFYGHAEATKTELGSGYSVSWQENDAISIFSGPENSRFEVVEITGNGKTAIFEGIVSAAGTYYAIYPYNENATIDGTTIHTELPAAQQAVAGSFDPAAALTAAKASGTSLYFMNAGAIVGFSVKGTDVASVTLSSADGMTPVAGEAAISLEGDTPVMTVEGANAICMSGPFAEGEEYYFTVAPGTYNGLALKFTDTQGRICVKTMTKSIVIDRCANKWLGEITIPDTAWKESGILEAECVAATSSTLKFKWSKDGSTDSCDKAYSFGLYKDRELTEPVRTCTSPDGGSVWKGSDPVFIFSGLDKGQTYYFHVCISGSPDCESEVIEATTENFERIIMGDVTAAAGAVILAEDFSEYLYGGDGVEPYKAAGIAGPGGSLCEEGKDTGLGTQPLLEGWSIDGGGTVFTRPGYLKLGNKGASAAIVTPELSCIPEGREARIKVSVSAARYEDDGINAIVSLITGTTSSDNKFTIDNEGNRKDVTFSLDESSGWNSYTFELEGARSDSRILIGPDLSDGAENLRRMFIDNIVVEVIELSGAAIEADFVAATSSTLKFKWSKFGSEASHNEAYTFGLYEDRELTSPVHIYSSAAGATVWGSKDPAFIFSGLDKGHTYYFHVYIDGNPDCRSEVIEATTENFERIIMGDVTAAAGAVILAEDFSEYLYGGDGVEPYKAAGIKDSGKELCPEGKDTGFGIQPLIEGWSVYGGTAYSRPGYLKLGGANASSSIVTPELSCIPEGQEASIRVTFSASRYGGDNVSAHVSLASGATSSSNKFTPVNIRTDKKFSLNGATEWHTYTYEFDGARSDSRILIGPDLSTGTERGRRMFLDNIVVEILSLEDVGISADFVAATSSTLKFKWTKCGSTASYNEAYTFGLYRDQELSDPVNVYSSAAGAAVWSMHDPVFIFSGLEKGRTYYFQVKDKNDSDCKSRIIAATVEEFTNVSPDNAQAAAGAVILAEDFSEFLHGGDGVGPNVAVGVNKSGTLVNSGSDTGIDMNGCLNKWSLLCQRITDNDNYTRPGYIKLGGRNYVSDLVTPELSCIPEGKKAKIRVTFSAAPYSTSELQSIISLIKVNSASHQFTKDEMKTIQSYQFNLPDKVEWNTSTYEFDGATNDSRVLIGPDADESGKGNGKNQSQHRMFLDNIVIEIISIQE